ncbi:MAG: hypothetical protein ACI9JM_002536 [Halioglobus sp.]|jgi:hypothetical protein
MSMQDKELSIRNGLIDNYNNYAEGLDSKNWPMLRGCFSDDVVIDYGTLVPPGDDPDAPRDSDDWIKILQGVINGFDITRHTITNHRCVITDEEVSCRAYLIADHIIFPSSETTLIGAADVVTVVGEYSNHYKLVDGVWRIWKSQLAVHWTSGNLELFPIGQARLAAQQS